MDRSYYLELGNAGLAMPVGTDLLLHEHADAEAIKLDGGRLGRIVAAAAERYEAPLAIPLMDLTIEKHALLEGLGVPHGAIPTFHFENSPQAERLAEFALLTEFLVTPRLRATVDAVAYIAGATPLRPVGMAIGPFSLATRLLLDPISAVYHAGRPHAAPSAKALLFQEVLDLATRVIQFSIELQMQAGAKAVFLCEPAANLAYISPRQMAAGSDVFDRLVLAPNRRIRAQLEHAGVDLIFHCCGEITDEILRQFTTLDPVILSLGSSRRLWEDAALVPKRTVLFGNLPTKKFYSDAEITREQAGRLATELITRMRAAGHPFILSSECDVLSVDGCRATIIAKVQEMLDVARRLRPDRPSIAGLSTR